VNFRSMPQFNNPQNVGLPFRRQVSESREQSRFGGIFVVVYKSYRACEQFIRRNAKTIGRNWLSMPPVGDMNP